MTLLPQRVVDIINALYAGVNPQDDGARRIAIQKVGEQARHDLGPRWGNKKRAGLSDDFRSPDSIAVLEDDQTVSVWDVQSSSGQILVVAGSQPTHPHLSPDEATFMPCNPVDHMGSGTPDPPDPPDPPSDDLEARVSLLETQQAEQYAVNERAQAALDDQAQQIAMLAAKVAHLETEPLRVVGPTTTAGASFLKHWHDINLTVQRG